MTEPQVASSDATNIECFIKRYMQHIKGNILYRFPSLQRTVAPPKNGRKEYVGRKWADWVGGEKFFKDNKWKFSKTSTLERAMVIGLAGLIYLELLFLVPCMLKSMTVSPTDFILFVSNIFPLLQLAGLIVAGKLFIAQVMPLSVCISSENRDWNDHPGALWLAGPKNETKDQDFRKLSSDHQYTTA